MYLHNLTGIDWKKVCSVNTSYSNNFWHYSQIDQDVMYSSHTSWVYAITDSGRIMKIGETGNPLGIEGPWYCNYEEIQPQSGTKCRLGRYRKHKGGDDTVRRLLRQETLANRIEIYAYPCPEQEIEMPINNQTIRVKSQIHKQLEKKLLDIIFEKDGYYPFCNTGRC